MGAKYIRNIGKVLRSTANRLFGAGADGVPAELEFSNVRTLLNVSTTAETATLLAAKADLVGGLVPANQLPSYVDDVVEAANQAALPVTGETGKIYVTLDTGKTYRWSGSAYVELTDATAVWGQISGTLSNQTDLNSALSGKQATLVSGTSIKTVNSTSLLGSGDITVGLSGTGSVDNAVLRADGTGGATLQNSAFVIADNATASPNNTVNHASIHATGGTTDVSVSINPKGAGAFCLSFPDSTATGGNARGANAVDLQRSRYSAAHVANGTSAGILSGANNTSSGTLSVVVGGQENSATTTYATVLGGGGGVANKHGMRVFASGIFAAFGDAQNAAFVLRKKTTDATPTTLLLDGSSLRLTITSGKILYADILICGIKSDGSAAACYKRKAAIKNVGGTTSLVGAVETMGTDIEDNASTDVAITADNTNDALDISVTGIAAETWRWVAVVEGIEIAYGT